MIPSSYLNGQLCIEGLSLTEIAKEISTPFYCYSQSTIEKAYHEYISNLTEIDATVCYAVKANSNQAIIKTLSTLGSGADVVSEGELRRALAAGIPPDKIVFSGVAKTESEMAFALSYDIFQFNVESENELTRLNKVALKMNKKAPIAFRINPDVDAKTHAKISTGKAENKFGIPISKAIEIYGLAAQLPGIKIQGVDVHIGSQLTCLQPFQQAFQRIVNLVEELRNLNISIEVIDVGGGLGVNYDKSEGQSNEISNYCKMVTRIFKNMNCRVILEPGRSLVANSGMLISKVVYKKAGQQSVFLIIDAAMNDLLRPSMYDAHHEILSVDEKTTSAIYDIVGPVCETGDTFARNRTMPEMQEGDLVAIASTGAYGAVMSSSYNTRLAIPEVLINSNRYSIIKTRGNYQSLLALDELAPWQLPATA